MGDMADYYWDLALVAAEGFAPVKCKHCGSTDTYWQNKAGAWALHNKSDLQPHRCFPASTADGFDDCSPEPKPVTHARSERTGAVVCKCGQGYGSERDGLCTRCRPQSKRTYTDNISFKDLGIL